MAANNWHIATNGSPAGDGTPARPCDLATALSGAVGKPGDVFWLQGGTYKLGHLTTKIQGAPGLPFTFRPVPGERARIDGSLSFFDSAGYVVLRDIEVFSSDIRRLSKQTNAGFHPTDIHPINGLASYAPNMSFINLVVHDETGEGIYISQAGTNNLVYGCVVFNNGWRSPDNAEGHGIYVQGHLGGREIADNIVFNNAGAGLHVYADEPGALLAGITLDGNVAFNAGAIQDTRFYRDWIIGVDAPAEKADGIVFQNNLGYLPLAQKAQNEDNAAQLGRQGNNGSVAILNNYLPQGLAVNNWTTATVSGNQVAMPAGAAAVSLSRTRLLLTTRWDSNNYTVVAADAGFKDNTVTLSFPGWQHRTGFDANSVCQIGGLHGVKVFVRSNRFQPGRANIIVYNWTKLGFASVDVSQVLPRNAAYEIRDAQNFYGSPVASGVYRGQPLILPMNGLRPAPPNGPMLMPPPTGPSFNVFVLLPRQAMPKLQLTGG